MNIGLVGYGHIAQKHKAAIEIITEAAENKNAIAQIDGQAATMATAKDCQNVIRIIEEIYAFKKSNS